MVHNTIRILGCIGFFLFHFVVVISAMAFALTPLGHPWATYLWPLAFVGGFGGAMLGMYFVLAALGIDLIPTEGGPEQEERALDQAMAIYALILPACLVYFGLVLYVR